MIEAVNVSLNYKDGTQALKDVNLKIKKGELVYITGPSGSGKTSLLKLFMGMEYPTDGSLTVLNQQISRGAKGKIQKMRREVGPVFQEFKLIQGRTAMENVMMGIRFLGIPSKRMKEEAINALERVGLASKIDSKVENLSFGQCQRVAIARAIARKPALILADEPTGNLDQDNALNILELLTSFKDKDTAVVITTHATHLIQKEKNVTLIHIKEGNLCIERRGEWLWKVYFII